ncbi:MAG TPA: hypothetical protein VHG09_00920, partial [Longimicrobiales bacterium]|nr:hypothetical protein [Longimicrobiales bacterium]
MATAEAHVHAPAPHTTKKKNVVWDWMTTVDHKKIDILYGVTALFFFLVGGLEATLIRIQLAKP